MTKEDQIQFIKNYLKSFEDEMVGKIEKGRVPENWDGHELRAWVTDSVGNDGRISIMKQKPRCKRSREYRNTMIVNNL